MLIISEKYEGKILKLRKREYICNFGGKLFHGILFWEIASNFSKCKSEHGTALLQKLQWLPCHSKLSHQESSPKPPKA